MSKLTFSWLMAMLLAIGLALSACGGDDSAAPPETGEPGAIVTSPAETETSSPVSPATTSASGGASAAESGSDLIDCDTPSTASGDPIVIGWTFAESGFMNFYDGAPRTGAQMAIDDLNKCGGVLGRPLEIVTADYKTDVNLVEGAAQQLIDQGVDFIHTACDYDFAAATARLANQAGILNFGCAGSTLFGKETLGPLTFNTWHGNPTEAAVIAEFVNKKGWKKPYILQDTTIQYTKEVCDLAERRLAELGVEPVGKDTFQQGDASYNGQVSKARSAADADVVVVCSVAPGGATLIKQLRDAGVELPIVGSAGGLDGTFWQEAVPDISNYFAAGAVYSLYGDDPNSALNELSTRIEEATGAPPALGHAAIGYSAIEMLARAIERAGSTDAEAVKAEIEKFSNEPLLVGPTTYTPDCHVPYGRPLAVIEFEQGNPKWVDTIAPEKVTVVQC